MNWLRRNAFVIAGGVILLLQVINTTLVIVLPHPSFAFIVSAIALLISGLLVARWGFKSRRTTR